MVTRTLFDHVEINWEVLTGPKLATLESPSPHARRVGAPSLLHVRDSDLRSVPALESLYGEAVHLGHLRDSEASFIRFVSTAAYCLRVGEKPAALFAYLVKAGEYPATLEDEDRAMSAVKRERSAELHESQWLTLKAPTL